MKRLLYIIIGVTALLAGSCSEDYAPDGLPVGENDGRPAASFQWTRAEDVETRKAFLRNFGVGYSYDAVRGSYCNWEDIRCQVINRAELERDAYLGEVMWASQALSYTDINQKVNYSQRDYVQSMDLATKQELDLGLYNETTRTRQYVLEEGLKDVFYYSTEDRIVKGEQYIIAPLIMEQVEYHYNDNLLTESFREAVEHLAYADDDDFAVVDSFINIWGTHVITRASLGAYLRLDLMNYMWRYTDNVQEESFTTEQLMGAYNNRKENRHQEENYKWIESSSLNISAKGGDQSLLGNIIGEAYYDGTRDFNMSDVGKWRESVVFNPADEGSSNVEMISMEVVPIWDFITYDHVARRVKAIVLQDASLQQDMLGDRNFFDATFPIRYPKATARYQQATGKWATITRTDSEAEPMVVNIVSGGRYVATICHEQLMDHDMWVCYPIYEGKVKLACGLGVTADNKVYQVRWLNGLARLTRLDQLDAAAAGGNFYINGGAVSVQPHEGLVYAEAHALPYVEISGGVQPDGGFSIPSCYHVLKQETTFSFWVPKGETATFIDWTANGEAGDKGQQYVRSADYQYIYNPTELNYE